MSGTGLDAGLVSSDNVAKILNQALDAGNGLLRLTPTWVPRSFLHPGRRIKLFPGDLYAFGADRGGIDERWFSSTTEAANEGRVWHEGLSFCLFEGKKFLLKDAVNEQGSTLVGSAVYSKYSCVFQVLR
jgi:hypothetical protein